MLAVEYPGYGLSWNEGVCTEKRLVEDAKRVLNFVIENTRLDRKDIIIYGRSLGTFLAAELAKQCGDEPPGALILTSPFVSLKGVIMHHAGRCCSKLISCFISDQMNVGNALLDIDDSCPVLMIHGLKDSLIPFQNSKRLYDILYEKRKGN